METRDCGRMPRALVRAALALLLIFSLTLASSQGAEASAAGPPHAPSPPRAPVPPSDKLAAAEKEILHIYREQFAKSDPASKAALAQELLKDGRELKDDLPGAYVLLRKAQELAAAVRDLDLARAAAKALAERFVLDEYELVVATLVVLSGQTLTYDEGEKALRAALNLLTELDREDRFEGISRLWLAVESLARCIRKDKLLVETQEALKGSRVRQSEWLRVKPSLDNLKAHPDDAAASLIAGRYYAQSRKDWAKALPLLAQCLNVPLKAAAAKELPQPADEAGRLAAGDAWWDAAEKETGPGKAWLRQRAVYWYEQIVDALTGLKHDVVEKRIECAYRPDPATLAMPLGWRQGLIRVLKEPTSRGYARFVPASRLAVVMSRASEEKDLFVYQVYDLETGEKRCTVSFKIAGDGFEAFAPDGRHMLTASRPPKPPGDKKDPPWEYRILDLMSGAAPAPAPLKYENVLAAAYGYDGQPVLAVQDGRDVLLVRPADDKPLSGLFRGLNRPRMAWFPERRELLAVVNRDVMILSVKTGSKKRGWLLDEQPDEKANWVSVEASSDQKHLALNADHDGGAWSGIVDLNTGKWVQWKPFPGERELATKLPRRLFFLPDSRRVASICPDGWLRVWDVRTWRELYSLNVAGVNACPSSDGRFMLVYAERKGVSLIGLPQGLWPGR